MPHPLNSSPIIDCYCMGAVPNPNHTFYTLNLERECRVLCVIGGSHRGLVWFPGLGFRVASGAVFNIPNTCLASLVTTHYPTCTLVNIHKGPVSLYFFHGIPSIQYTDICLENVLALVHVWA